MKFGFGTGYDPVTDGRCLEMYPAVSHDMSFLIISFGNLTDDFPITWRKSILQDDPDDESNALILNFCPRLFRWGFRFLFAITRKTDLPLWLRKAFKEAWLSTHHLDGEQPSMQELRLLHDILNRA